MSQLKGLCPLPFAKGSRDKAPMTGALCQTSDFCKKRYNDTCNKFYKSINKAGISTCPYGFSCYSFRVKNEYVSFSSIIIKGFFDGKKLTQGNRLPEMLLTKEFVDNCKVLYQEQQKAKDKTYEARKENGLFSSAIHEVRNFNSQLKAIGDIAQHKTDDDLRYPMNSSFAISQMISSRLNYLSYRLNPKQSRVQEIRLLKKIDKAVRLIRPIATAEKSVKVEFIGDSNNFVEGYDFLEQLPAILIHNAFKFALKNTSVEIEIKNNSDFFEFTVQNVGTYIYPDEYDKIFQTGYRGREAKRVGIEGTGLGLDFVLKILKIHNATIDIVVGEPTEYSDDLIANVEFTVKIPLIVKV